MTRSGGPVKNPGRLNRRRRIEPREAGARPFVRGPFECTGTNSMNQGGWIALRTSKLKYFIEDPGRWIAQGTSKF